MLNFAHKSAEFHEKHHRKNYAPGLISVLDNGSDQAIIYVNSLHYPFNTRHAGTFPGLSAMRVGIIGLGFRLGYLARIFDQTVPGFSVAGYVDPNPAGLEYAQKHGVAMGRAFGSLAELIASEKLDLLMVGSPNHLHLEHLTEGLASGFKIFAEKPVVTSVAETMALAKLLSRHDPDQVMVGLVLRYGECSTSAMRSIGSSGVDPYSAAAGALSALYGPLHGGANEQVLRMLAEIGSKDKVPAFIEDVKESGGLVRLMGFGHRVYKNYDPRAKIIKMMADKVFEVTGRN